MRDLPWSKTEPVSLSLASGFFTIEPPGKPGNCHLKNWLSVTVNLFVHLSTLCPNIRLSIILGVPVKVFLDEVSIWIGSLSKEFALPKVDGPHPILFRPQCNQKGVRKNSLSASLSFSWDLSILLPLNWKLYHQLFCFSALWTETGMVPLALLGLVCSSQPP